MGAHDNAATWKLCLGTGRSRDTRLVLPGKLGIDTKTESPRIEKSIIPQYNSDQWDQVNSGFQVCMKYGWEYEHAYP